MHPTLTQAASLPQALPTFRVSLRPAHSAILLAAVLGMALRIAAANGDLGLDEAWSLKLVGELRGIGAVFWGLPHDNNHVLNSAWLFLLGPGRPVWLYRLPAIIFGTLTIVAVARCLARDGQVVSVVGAALAAVSLPLVDFGSEARGYAGLALASVLALDACGQATEAALPPARPDPFPRRHWQLGLATTFGAMSHLGMVLTIAVLAVTTVIRIGASTGRMTATLVLTGRLFLPAVFGLLPVAAALAASIHHGGHFTIGDIDPFSTTKLARGFGDMLALTTGLPDTVPPTITIAATLIGLMVAARWAHLPPRWSALGVAALVVLPAAIAIYQPPNVGYARYFLICGLVLLMIQANVLGRLWSGGWAGRRGAVAGFLVIMTGGLALDALQIGVGRSAAGTTLSIMRAEGHATYVASHPAMAALLLGVASRPVAPPLAVSEEDFCQHPPDWYMAVGLYDPTPGASVSIGPDRCRATFRVRRPFLSSFLSGTQWTLYRRI